MIALGYLEGWAVVVNVQPTGQVRPSPIKLLALLACGQAASEQGRC